LFQQYAAEEDNGNFENKIRPYVDQVRMVIVVSFGFRFLISLFGGHENVEKKKSKSLHIESLIV
jgi:hypothetical protein